MATRPAAVRAARRSYKAPARTRQLLPKLGEPHGTGDVGKCCGDALVERALARCGRRRGVGRSDDLQCEGGSALRKRDDDGCQRRRGPMFDGQRQVIAIAAQIEVGIAPGVELG